MALTFIPTSCLPRSSLGIIEGERKEVFSKALVLSWVITHLAKSKEWGGYTAVKDGGQSMRVSYLEYRSSYPLHTGTQWMQAEWWGNYEDHAFRSFVKVKTWFIFMATQTKAKHTRLLLLLPEQTSDFRFSFSIILNTYGMPGSQFRLAGIYNRVDSSSSCGCTLELYFSITW